MRKKVPMSVSQKNGLNVRDNVSIPWIGNPCIPRHSICHYNIYRSIKSKYDAMIRIYPYKPFILSYDVV